MEIYNPGIIFWIAALIGVIITGISKSGFAGGARVVAVPIMALFIPISDAIFLMLQLLIVMDARVVQYYWRSASMRDLKILLPAAFCGIAIGGLALGTFPERYLQIALGFISVGFALWGSLAPVLGRLPGAGWIWGTISGITSTLIHAGGPPLNIYMIAKQRPKTEWLATAGIFFAVANVTKIGPYLLTGDWRLTLFVTSLLLIPIAFVATWLGKRCQESISEAAFMKVCRGLLLFSGCSLIFKAFT